MPDSNDQIVQQARQHLREQIDKCSRRAAQKIAAKFDREGSDRISFCQACGNVFAPTPFQKQRVQRGPANGTSNSPDRTDSS